MKSFPTLYKKNSKGKLQVWNISARPSIDVGSMAVGIIEISHGQEGGKMQETSDTIKEGKNVGKVNETTAYQQAELEAESKWTAKQEREGYVTDRNAVDTDLRIGAEPMLAQRFDKYPDKMPFPAIMQPKLDGHRCIAVISTDKVELFSRTRTLITGVPHINAELLSLLGHKAPLTLDGELYNHDYKAKFEELTGFIRSQEPKTGHEAVQYHVYDQMDSRTYQFRGHDLELLFDGLTPKYIRVIESCIVDSDDVTDKFKYFVDQGYEGAMLRNLDSLYEGKRSYGLMKVKEFEDAEFTIVGVKEGRGKLQGHAIFECRVDEATTFDVKLKGSEDRLKEIFQDQPKYLGKNLTVQFQGRTKNNIPRFPVGVRLREDV